MAFVNPARVVIKGVRPQIEDGRYPIKRVTGQKVEVEADIFADGHDSLSVSLLYRHQAASEWNETSMRFLVNDLWQGSFEVGQIGKYIYTIAAWIDRYTTWKKDLLKRFEAGQKELETDFAIGARLIAEASRRAAATERQILQNWSETLQSAAIPISSKIELAAGEALIALMRKYPDKNSMVYYSKELEVTVDRTKALFGSWYEMFPRSCSSKAGVHGSFKDCENQLSYVRRMGFDILYFPPIHPIGHTNRKGKNNSLEAAPGDPGTPWAIGSEEGGHKSVHPQLGSLEDFRRFLSKAGEQGIDVALDIAFQCSPDHPYVNEHPEWFTWRPDGTVQYAENPPKKYQDIFPINFETADWQNLWRELKSVITFWIEQGISIFRVDNPHTKSFYFWEWLIAEIKKEYPQVIFLAEAFTRPKVMNYLAQLGFSQSYTYFTWRNTKWELTRYFEELNQSELKEYFRPNVWPNTPDILSEYLQSGGRPAFMVRLVLAATLSASYGIYGPAFELCVDQPREPGSEEYLDSEKYEIKHWDIDRADSLADFIGRVNRIRRENAALQNNSSLRFHEIDNDRLICYTKNTEDFSNIILVIVNLDPHHNHSGWLDLHVDTLGLDAGKPYQVHDLLSGVRYLWYDAKNYVEINPRISPAYVFRIRRYLRTEKDFDYYLEKRGCLMTDIPAILEAKSQLKNQDLWSERKNWPPLETVLQEYIKDRRWFRSKARHIRSCFINDVVPIRFLRFTANIVILQVNFTSGLPEVYTMPVMITGMDYAREATAQYPAAVIAQVKFPDKSPDQMCFDAMADRAFCSFLLESIGRQRRFKGTAGEIIALSTGAFQNIRGLTESSLIPALVKAEQTNTSVIFGNKAIFKLLRTLGDGVNPELEIGRFLTERTSFVNIPPLLGALEYHSGNQPVRSMAILQSYVPNKGDAWQYTLDSLEQYFRSVPADPASKAPPVPRQHLLSIHREPPLLAINTFGSYLNSARLLAQRTAELHQSLASAADDPAFAPEPFTLSEQNSAYLSLYNLTMETFRMLEERQRTYPDETDQEIKRILELKDKIIQRYEFFRTQKIATVLMRCHGDYHLGQVLYTGEDFVIIDFEGEPARPLSERRAKRSPLQDVTGMLRSFHYASYSAMFRESAKAGQENAVKTLQPWVRYWYTWVSVVFLQSYLNHIRPAHLLPGQPDQLRLLLDAYLLGKAIYEMGYELNNRPDWLKVPLHGILQLMEH